MIAVVGATGRTGRQVLEQGLARGHQMIGVARNTAGLSRRHDNLRTVTADVLDRDSIVKALAGADAVVSALGIGTSRAATVVYSEGIANVLHGMAATSAGKLAVISAAPASSPAEQSVLQRRVLMPLLELAFGATYADMRRMEVLLRDSDVDWISLRPPRLVSGKPTGHYRVQVDRPLRRALSIRYADLATALLDVLDRADLYRRAAFVAS